jgi:hypothetical protein
MKTPALVYEVQAISPRVLDLGDDTLTPLQEAVGGYVQTAAYGSLTLAFNEEGLLRQLPPNPFFPKLVGNVVVTKVANHDFVGLSEAEIQEVQAKLGN